MMTMTTETSGTERTLRWIGDLDHPFYSDERQRFVWYEASTIAVQLFLFANVFLMGLMMWVGGSEGLPYAFAIFVVTMAIVSVAQQYAKARYAEFVPKKEDLVSNRSKLYFAVLFFMITGMIRAVVDVEEGDTLGFLFDGAEVSIAVGAVAGVGAGISALAWKRRKLEQAEEADEF